MGTNEIVSKADIHEIMGENGRLLEASYRIVLGGKVKAVLLKGKVTLLYEPVKITSSITIVKKLKRFALFIFGSILLILMSILPAPISAATVESEFAVIATKANNYLNDADTVFNTASYLLLTEMLDDDPYILDTRAANDYAVGHIHGAVNMSASELFTENNLNQLPKDRKIYVCCYTGHTASQVTAMLNMCGYDATNLTWGIMGWTKDETVATKRFSNPATDLSAETIANVPTMTYTTPTLDYTSSGDEAEVIRAACDEYAGSGYNNITVADLNTLITDGDTTNDPVIVSVRSSTDYSIGHIPGAINIAFKDIAKEENLEKLDPDQQIVVYCNTGRTSSQATAILNILGYNAKNLLWGISGWTTDTNTAPYRFNPDTSVDYPCETGAGGSSNHLPITPTNTSPADESISVSLTPTLASTIFHDCNTEDVHAASQWQISTNSGDYSSTTYDSGTDTINRTSISILSGTLSKNTTYYWRVRHKDSHGSWSEWSSETSFTTAGSGGLCSTISTISPPSSLELISGWIIIGVLSVAVIFISRWQQKRQKQTLNT